jgi:hypothetical protein
MAKQQKDAEMIELAKSLQGTPWCDEYENMISGMLYVMPIPTLHPTARDNTFESRALTLYSYNPLHPKLLEGRHNARCKTYTFNNLDPSIGNYEQVATKRAELLSGLLGKVGQGTFIEPPFLPDYGCNILIGENCFMNFG